MNRTPRFVLAALLLAFLAWTAHAGAADGTLEVYWVDVEGGGATLIVTPAGESVLIDSGYPGDRDAKRIAEVAAGAGVKQIDHLVTTHYHLDHFGGAATLATLMPIRRVYDNGDFKEGWEKPAREYWEFKADQRVVLAPGDDIPLRAERAKASPPLRIQCLAARQKTIPAPPDAAPNPDCAHARRQRPDYGDNANSINLLLTFGSFHFFDGGDTSWNVELKLVCPVRLVPPVDVYQVNHHGQASSNNPLLIAALSPTVAVMNNGPRKGGQPPTFATLKQQPSIGALYQVHKNVKPGEEDANPPDEFIANVAEACQGNFIKMTVAADGKSYAISIPATGYTRTFETRSETSPSTEPKPGAASQ